MIRFDWDKDFPRKMKRLSSNVRQMNERLENRTEPMQKIKSRQIKRWQKNFFSQGGEYQSWAPLRPFTVRRRIGGADIPLIETGGLLTHFTRLNANGEVTNDAVNWNMTNAGGFGGAAHILEQHFGINPNKGKPMGPGVQMGPVPPRTLWDMDDRDDEENMDILDQWATRIIDQYFGV